ncbi:MULTISPECIES: MBL fold metallo-hydrolase [Bacillales]|jgi:glyoxylase-like metal-dependent hydrolase (beta-lactamase superfamily II)/rhodanese-related sulfurtransferase|uniref:MBL fold metallo-hydrolase n=1 Tax=Brevibacillus TaxID=55080 RepID=UPI001490B077|nr:MULTISPECIES: MBL fold metallo-hydrolase [Bacillales]NNV04032.1 MBL fold metallo-hydrolase [Brevibacillus sp. MCWH]UFJ60971.1 MBL fold metallo-hydrolase [Anoxybacillus sediminis]
MEQVRSITAEELHRKMSSGEDLVILDVRNETDYNEWKIEGKNLRTMNIPYFHFLEEDVQVYAGLPKDAEIVIVCAKGGASHYVAEMLMEKGYNTCSLQGGMLAWSQFYHPTIVYMDDQLKLIQINRLAKGCLSYAVISDGKGMIIDPNKEIDVYIELAKTHQFEIEHVVDSHMHADHITGGPRLAKQVGATYYISSEEAKGTNLKFEPLDRYDRIKVGDVHVEVLSIPTPGHTPGSTSFLIDNRFLLSGDTIFVGGLGRPDLGGKAKEWAEDLYHTVFFKLKDLPDDCLVLPAHYADIQEINDRGVVGELLGKIRENNEIMRNVDKASFTEQVASAASMEKPPNFEEIVAINRGELQVDQERAIELEIGPNRCAVHHHG